MLKFLPAFIAVLLMISCSSSDCSDNRNSLPLAGFYVSGDSETPVAVSHITVAGVGAPGDSLLLDDASGVEEVFLPFRIDASSTTFLFYIPESGLQETVTFNYELKPRLASAECGVVYDYLIKSISHTGELIDSVVCPTGLIDNTQVQNLRIYLRAAEEQE